MSLEQSGALSKQELAGLPGMPGVERMKGGLVAVAWALCSGLNELKD